MRIFFSVGEPSGDLHASNLIKSLCQRDPDVECVGFGGPKMKAAGCDVLFDLTQLAVMFLSGAFKNIRQFLKLVGDADRYFQSNELDAVVLIDFSGFNWWIARKAKKHGIPVFYYGVPQMWAWGPWRIKKLRRLVDHVLCKLPFEVEWFAQRGCQATYIGHPYFDQLNSQSFDQEFLAEMESKSPGSRLLVLLPGSRDMEIDRNLQMMLDTASLLQSKYGDLRVAVACYNEKHLATAQELVASHNSEIQCVAEKTPELMKSADLCLACSGSVSLELMYHRKPTVIVYKVGRIIMWVQRIALRCKFITLTNLLATDDIRKTNWQTYDPDLPDAERVPMPEYLTRRDCPERLTRYLEKWLSDDALYQSYVRQLDQLATDYARPGATQRAADYIFDQLKNKESFDTARSAA